MSYSHAVTENWSGPGRAIQQTNTFTADGTVGVDVPVSTGETDYVIDATVDVSEVKCVYIHSDQAVTMKTYDGAALVDTIALLAGKPLVWYYGSYYTNLLTADFTAFKITNTSGETAQFHAEILIDTTPA